MLLLLQWCSLSASLLIGMPRHPSHGKALLINAYNTPHPLPAPLAKWDSDHKLGHIQKSGFGDRKYPPFQTAKKLLVRRRIRFCYVAPCSPVIYQRFGVTWYLHREGGRNGDTRFLRNFDKFLPVCMVSQTRGQ